MGHGRTEDQGGTNTVHVHDITGDLVIDQRKMCQCGCIYMYIKLDILYLEVHLKYLHTVHVT